MLEPRYNPGIYNNNKHQHYQFDEPPIDYSDADEDVDSNEIKHFHYQTQQQQINFDLVDDDDDVVEDEENNNDIDHYNVDLYDIVSRSTQMSLINFKRLTFEKLIGYGGFGRVYRGKLNSITVAIKEPIYNGQQSFNMMNRSIIDEARLHFHLDHPNIIKMFGISIQNNKIYLIMEYAQGGSLRELLTKRALSPNIIIKFAIQISSAMEYLHSFKPKPIIHRDLKSLNVLLNEPINGLNWSTKQIKLTDLGLAREFTNSTLMTQCGTYAWMAPESITDSKFSKASDVWSFGVVLWELLTGQIPYKNVSGAAVAFGIGNGKLTLPIPKTCPEELKVILRECWLQNPKDRPCFRIIRKSLEQSSFNVIKMEQFTKMKQNWFEEIETMWKNIRKKEKELEFREEKAKLKEEEAKRKEQEIERMQHSLIQQSQELKRREIEVVGRELNFLLQQQHKKPYINLKSRKRIAKKNLQASNHPAIGYPQNFCHNLTVTTTKEENKFSPSLQARALNQTWTPGTKIRPELHADLFSISRSSSISQESHDKEYDDDQCLREKSKLRRKKRIGFLWKKIFKSSKSSLDKEQTDLSTLNKNSQNISTNGEIDLYPNETYDVVDGFEIKRDYPFPINHTYHGQTKHSERRRLTFFHIYGRDSDDYANDDDENEDNEENEHNQSCGSNDDVGEKYFVRTYQKFSNKQNQLDDDNSREKYSDMNRINIKRIANSQNQNASLNNKMFSNHYYYHSPEMESTNFISDSEQTFDEDLLKEIDLFEQEFQSMNCS